MLAPLRPRSPTPLFGQAHAIFGDWNELEDMAAAVATPLTACTPLANSVPGGLMIAQRGGCTFFEKAKNAQAAGAEAIVIVNSATGATLGSLSCGAADDCESIRIPVLAVEVIYRPVNIDFRRHRSRAVL